MRRGSRQRRPWRVTAERVELGQERFPSKKAAKSHVQGLLVKLTGSVVEPGVPEFDLLLAVFQRHPSFKEKLVQPPVLAFRAVVNVIRPSCREVQFKDGRGVWEAFSYDKCIYQKEDSPEEQLDEAMRSAVKGQLEEYQKKLSRRCCAICRSVYKRGR